MSRRYLLLSACLLPLPVYAQSQLCEQVPDCAELGFTTGYEDSCADDGYLTCPFDSNFRKCVKHSCEKMGFTKDDKSTWCDSIVECESDATYTLCKSIENCDDYPLAACPSNAECETCEQSGLTKYKVTNCKPRYSFCENSCVRSPCYEEYCDDAYCITGEGYWDSFCGQRFYCYKSLSCSQFAPSGAFAGGDISCETLCAKHSGSETLYRLEYHTVPAYNDTCKLWYRYGINENVPSIAQRYCCCAYGKEIEYIADYDCYPGWDD